LENVVFDYVTEEQQLEAITRWWRRYGNYMLLMLSVILLVVAGYRYWLLHQTKTLARASVTYEHLMQAVANHDEQAAESYATALTQSFDGTAYSAAGFLVRAKQLAAEGQYDKARSMLKHIHGNASLAPLVQVASLRIAKLLVAEAHYDEALAELKPLESSVFRPVVMELTGDIYRAMGQSARASSAYQLALNEAHARGVNSFYLELKVE
jgi:predicted negative regulator of RcsB-dependent stress response